MNINSLSADKPLVDPAEDRFYYAEFAKEIANSIQTMVPPEGLVLAINGVWGSGKSTTVEFVVHYLKQLPEDEQPIIVRFNPWLFSGTDSLIRRFFEQLQIALGDNLKKRPRRVVHSLQKLGNAIGEQVPAEEPADIARIKASIAKRLKKQDKQILVLIDDVDRLFADEMLELFKVIKAIADFPDVVYLLVFDAKVVEKALEQRGIRSGQEYLAKIVQVPFELPAPGRVELLGVLIERFREIIGELPRELLNINPQGISTGILLDVFPLINTPRDIFRLTNTLNVTYPAVRGEVNAADFVALETLRVFNQNVYNAIRDNKPLFTNGSLSEQDKADYKRILEGCERPQVINKIVMSLFPKFGGTDSQEFAGRNELRLCNSNHFDTYFRLAIPTYTIAQRELQAIVENSADESAFSAALLKLSPLKLGSLLRRFSEYADANVPISNIGTIVKALFNIGDQLIDSRVENQTWDDKKSRLIGIIYQLLFRVDPEQRFEILKVSLAASASTLMPLALFLDLGQRVGKYGATELAAEPQRVLDADQVAKLETIALGKIQTFVARGKFKVDRDFLTVLQLWLELDRPEAQKWIHDFTQDVGQLSAFMSIYSRNRGAKFVVDKSLYIFFDRDELAARLDDLIKRNALDAKQKAMAEGILKVYGSGHH